MEIKILAPDIDVPFFMTHPSLILWADKLVCDKEILANYMPDDFFRLLLDEGVLECVDFYESTKEYEDIINKCTAKVAELKLEKSEESNLPLFHMPIGMQFDPWGNYAMDEIFIAEKTHRIMALSKKMDIPVAWISPHFEYLKFALSYDFKIAIDDVINQPNIMSKAFEFELPGIIYWYSQYSISSTFLDTKKAQQLINLRKRPEIIEFKNILIHLIQQSGSQEGRKNMY